VIFRIAEILTTLLAPVLSFTAEEVWRHLPGDREESVHLASFPDAGERADDAEEEDSRIRRLLALREVVLAQMENLRQESTIGKSEEARVVVGGDTGPLKEDLEATGIELARLLIVSAAGDGEIADGTAVAAYPGLQIAVEPYDAPTCSRCWRRFDELVGDSELPDLCHRCHGVVTRLLAENRAELRRTDD
jgi:isoleucyl-tRNA synthetase